MARRDVWITLLILVLYTVLVGLTVLASSGARATPNDTSIDIDKLVVIYLRNTSPAERKGMLDKAVTTALAKRFEVFALAEDAETGHRRLRRGVVRVMAAAGSIMKSETFQAEYAPTATNE